MMVARHFALLGGMALAASLACGSPPPAQSPDPGGSSESPGDDGATHQSEPPSEGEPQAQPEQAATAPQAAQAPKPGTQALDRRGLEFQFALTLMRGEAAAGVQTGSWSFTEERTHRVIASNDSATTKLQVVYGKWEAKPLLGLVYEVPTDGNSYTVASSGGSATVERTEGKPMSDDEKTAVMNEYGWVGGAHPVLAAIERAGAKPGAELDVDTAFINALVGAIPGVDHAKSQLTARLEGFESSGRKTARLAVVLKSDLHTGPTVFSLELKGPATVDMLTGWTSSLALEGTLVPGGQVKVQKKMLDVHGKGTAKLTRESTFK
jgi:hypothetical protein